MKSTKRILALILSIVLTALLSLSVFAAETDNSAADSTGSSSSESTETSERVVDSIITNYNNANGSVLVAAKNGYPREYPEDSAEGLQYCIDNGIQIVAMSVQKTKDGQFVFFEDSTLDRMCISVADGGPATGKVSDYTLEELQTNYVLRNSRGGNSRKASESTIMSFEEALSASKDYCILYIENGFKYAEELNTLARTYNACDVVILGGATSTDSVSTFTKETGTPICHITATFVDGTTDARSKNFVSDAIDAGADAVMLQSDDEYSSIFKESTMKKFDSSGRAMIDASSLSTSGGYEDRIAGWEQLIAAGYNIIETDYPTELVNYISNIESYRATLSSLITQAMTINTDNYDSDTAKALKNALQDAEDISSTGAVTLDQLDEARFNLQESIDTIMDTTPVARTTPVWEKILIAVAVIVALAVLVILGLRIYNKEKKKAKNKNALSKKDEFKRQFVENLKNAETSIDDSNIKPISKEQASNAIMEKLGIDIIEDTAEDAPDEAVQEAEELSETPAEDAESKAQAAGEIEVPAEETAENSEPAEIVENYVPSEEADENNASAPAEETNDDIEQ